MTPRQLVTESLPYIAAHLNELTIGLVAFAAFLLFVVAAAAWRGR